MSVLMSRKDIYAEIGKELDKQGFGDNIPVDYTQLGFELHFQNGILETRVFFRQTSRSRKVEIKTS